jgi:hypothetical protein
MLRRFLAIMVPVLQLLAGVRHIMHAPVRMGYPTGVTRNDSRRSAMKAVVYKGPFDIAVEEVPDPRIEQPLDAIIRIPTANICGSDLHPYEGRAPLEAGMVLGHENMGVVQETGPGPLISRQLRRDVWHRY